MSQLLPKTQRKYVPILEELIVKAICRVACELTEAVTIMHGVKKEKVKWVKAKKWPEGQALKMDVVDTKEYKGVEFKMVLDTSVNNL